MKLLSRRRIDRISREWFLLRKSARQSLNRARSKSTVFVSGVQRSGTNMLMQVLECAWNSEVFHESDPRAFDDFMMRDRSVIHGLVDRSAAPVVVVKALHEGHELVDLMREFAPSRAFWMVRRYDDMVNSNLLNWPGGRNEIEAVVADRHGAEWRGRGMTDETHAVVRDAFRPGMNDASAIALFWCYRNQLFFDQGLDRDDRVLPIQYELLATRPDLHIDRIAAFADLRPSARMRTLVHAQSIGKRKPPEILPHIRELCETMQARLFDACWGRWQSTVGSSDEEQFRRMVA